MKYAALWSVCLLALSGCSGSGGDDDADGRDASTRSDGGEDFGNASHHGDGGLQPFDAGGGDSNDDGSGQAGKHAPPPPVVAGVMDLRIEPGSDEVKDDGVDPGETLEFHAIGTFKNGERDVTDLVAWSLDDAELGEIKAGVFTSASIGGKTKVHARAVGVAASAEITVLLELQLPSDGAPDGIEELFPKDMSDDEVADADMLRIVYPSHETMFPRNLERVDHQWHADAALDRFEVRFESDVALLRFYTDGTHLLPDSQAWHWLANTHAGRSLQMTVRGTSSAAPDKIVRSQTITLYYSRSEVPGALYYWSTGAAGVLKATISSQVANKFFTDPSGDDTTCVSCHTVSRNGQKLAAAYGGEKLRVVSVPNRDLLVPTDPMAKALDYGWGTFSPNASRLLYASKGALTMFDVDNAEALFKVTLPATYFGTHPDWAPNDKSIAIAYGKAKIDNKNALATSLARLPVQDDGTLGEPEVLLASEGTNDTIFFPSYSPNSKWIAFVRATGKSKDNVTSKLYLVSAEGGTPIELTRLNERVRDEDGIIDIGNSMPTWAPSTKPDVFWLAFSSLRAYGDVSDGDLDQLWAVAIDPAKIEKGEDPSYAAFWLPFQDLKEGNHRAFWAIDTEQDCPSKIEICDDLDNDCDGVVDEQCCTPHDEECDGEDNNCDGVVDEGCCIPSEEICDGIDNNCNLVADEDCCTPSEEVCDGIDNDCDLIKDEGCGCKAEETCGNGKDDDCDDSVDEHCDCKAEETCGNGNDDDCDNEVDEGCVD